MALTEQRVLKSVEILPAVGIAQVCWADQVFRGDELIAETLERRAYAEESKDTFMDDVENAQAYLVALGWSAE
ncbi:hypothetical protein A7J71_18125 [Achromobacter insolitus]|uniref:hypothetical protein n=1 Tax=Achromobacter insolitus TaxID=217204 RepID=UPI0007C78865|nr:hypothetical protein [Achromobacter insolitus]OAE52885.1 hypothetical protein A7J71_18125 [Achromobacter insolitus]OCZ50629.1 hypothetical protein A7P22_15215 [Achromobacter insolitus]